MVTRAGVDYDLAVRAVDQVNVTLAAPDVPGTAPVTTQYVVADGKVRIGGASSKMAYLLKDQTIYIIDNAARAVHVLKHATLRQAAAQYADAVEHLAELAAAAPPDRRAAALQKMLDLKAVSERLRRPVLRDYRVTVRFESVDGRACRIWEEREEGVKRLELCVAPPGTVPGGAEILAAMKTLSQFRQGSDVALGVEFGLSEWWPDVARLGGVPLLIREFKFESVTSETMLTAMHTESFHAALLEIPADYPVQEGPDYAQWYVR